MPRINNKVEILRSLERTKEQFEVQYQEDCEGNQTGAFPEFSDTDKELMESFKKIYQLGITQLQDFVNQLDKDSDKIDEYSILYYITQLSNGPLANQFRQFTANKGRQSIYGPANDHLGSITHSIKSNSTVPVFQSNSINAGLGIFNKSTGFIQGILRNANKQTAAIYDANFQSSIFDDNTLPFLDKAPWARANAEGPFNFGASSLGLAQIADIGPRFIDAATGAMRGAVQDMVGQIAVAGMNEVRGAINQFTNLIPGQGVRNFANGVTNQVIGDATNFGANIIQQSGVDVQLAGNGFVRDTVGSLNGLVTNFRMGASNLIQAPGGILSNLTATGGVGSGNMVGGLVNTGQEILQNASGGLLNAGTGVIQNSLQSITGGVQSQIQNAFSMFGTGGFQLQSLNLDGIMQGAVSNLQNIGQGIVMNAAGDLGSSIGKGLGGKGTLLGSFAMSYVGGLLRGDMPTKPSQSRVNALGGGGGSWSPGTANANYMLKDIKMHNIISEATEDITKSLEASLGPAFRLLAFKKTLNYFNSEENESVSTGDPISRLLTFMKKVRGQSGNEQIKQQCVEIETSLLGNSIVNDNTTNLKAYYNTGTVDLYTNTGRLGNRPITPADQEDVEKVDDADINDIFTTIDAATGRSIEIGCVGYHQHNEDGTTYYMPCNTMEEYCELTGNCPEQVDPDYPLIGDVDCEEPVMTTTTTPEPDAPTTTTTTTTPVPNYDRPSPFVDVISALSQYGDEYYAGHPDGYPADWIWDSVTGMWMPPGESEDWVLNEDTGQYEPPADWIYLEEIGKWLPPGEGLGGTGYVGRVAPGY